MSAEYVQVNIGRNVDGEPMSDEQWERFQDAVTIALLNAHRGSGIPNVSIHTGEGFWNDETTGELMSEESAYLSTFADIDAYALRVDLARIRDEYEQDAIALIIGSDLI